MKLYNSKSIPVTVIIPVKNEEINIKKCLNKLESFSQVIVVDSSSTDRTKEYVINSGSEYVNFVWNGAYPKKRNWVLDNYPVKNDWVLFLDADEFVNQEFIEEVVRSISVGGYDAFWLSYKNYFMGREQKFGLPMRKIALFKTSFRYERIDEISWSQLDMEVHEHPVIKGKIGRISTRVEHNDYKDLKHYLDRHNQYAEWEAMRFKAITKNNRTTFTFRQRLKYLLLSNPMSGTLMFFYVFIVRLGFLDGKYGYYFSKFKAFYYLSIAAKINESSSH